MWKTAGCVDKRQLFCKSRSLHTLLSRNRHGILRPRLLAGFVPHRCTHSSSSLAWPRITDENRYTWIMGYIGVGISSLGVAVWHQRSTHRLEDQPATAWACEAVRKSKLGRDLLNKEEGLETAPESLNMDWYTDGDIDGRKGTMDVTFYFDTHSKGKASVRVVGHRVSGDPLPHTGIKLTYGNVDGSDKVAGGTGGAGSGITAAAATASDTTQTTEIQQGGGWFSWLYGSSSSTPVDNTSSSSEASKEGSLPSPPTAASPHLNSKQTPKEANAPAATKADEQVWATDSITLDLSSQGERYTWDWATQSFQGPVSLAADQSTSYGAHPWWSKAGWASAVSLPMLMGVLIWWRLRTGGIGWTFAKQAKKHPEVQRLLGSPVRVQRKMFGISSPTIVNCTYNCSGPAGSGKLHLQATQQNNNWLVSVSTLRLQGRSKAHHIELSDPFKYSQR